MRIVDVVPRVRRVPRSLALDDVLGMFLDTPALERHGLELVEHTGLPPTTVYPLLRRLQDVGVLVARIDESDAGGRTYYRLADDRRDLALGMLRPVRWPATGRGARLTNPF